MEAILIVDDRERAVVPSLECDESSTSIIVQRLTVGDYIIVHGDVVEMVIERKSLADFGASIKDGRYNNSEKVINFLATASPATRARCKIAYIIEGPLINRPNDCYGGIPYKHIESAINRLMLEDNFHILYTANIAHTAKKLVSLTQSITRLRTTEVPIDQTVGGEEPPFVPAASLTTDMAALTTVQPTADVDVVRCMWCVLRGISVVSADIFIRQHTLADIINQRVDAHVLKNFKSANGRLLGKHTTASLLGLMFGSDKTVEIRLLAEIPRISKATSTTILANRSLRELLQMDVGAISLIQIGAKQKSLGMAAAANIIKFFNWKVE